MQTTTASQILMAALWFNSAIQRPHVATVMIQDGRSPHLIDVLDSAGSGSLR